MSERQTVPEPKRRKASKKTPQVTPTPVSSRFEGCKRVEEDQGKSTLKSPLPFVIRLPLTSNSVKNVLIEKDLSGFYISTSPTETRI